MRIDLPYGDESRSLLAPGGVGIDHVTPSDEPAIDDISAALGAACAGPVDSKPLAARAGSGTKVLLLVSDLTRSPATKDMLPAMVAELEGCGVARGDMSVLVARGTHRSLTKEEKAFFREGAMKGLAFAEHDCDDASSLGALLLTKRGTPVRIHRAVCGADLVILLSPVSFHYFAGYGGGRKLILPGCADRDAILANHRLSLCDSHPVTLHPSCRPGNLQGNPVHDDMVEVVQALSHLFAVNFFAGVDGQTHFVNAGDPVFSHDEACSAYAAHYRIDGPARSSVVIASAGGSPYDINLLQAHKAVYHAAEATVEGGSIVLYARCGEGVGSESLAHALARPRDEFLDDAREDYALNNQTAVSLLRLTEKYRIAMVTELDDDVLECAGIERCSNAEAWVAEALEEHGAGSMSIIKYCGQTLPRALKE